MDELKKDSIDVASKILSDGKVEASMKRIKAASYALLIIAILTLLQNFMLNAADYSEDFYFSLIDVAVFIGLFLLSFKAPKIAFILGLLFYFVPHLVMGIFNPDNAFRGIILKIVLSLVLVQGLVACYKLPKSNTPADEALLDNFN